MPNAKEYALLKERGGAEFMRREVERYKRYVRDNRAAFNERRRHNFRHQLSRIKKQARDREYAFELTDNYVRTLLDAPCVYCGRVAEPFNTIDRLDNSKGYVKANVATCCNTCNMAKGCLDPSTFIERCKHISFVHTGLGEPHTTCWSSTRHASVTMPIYTRVAKKKKLDMELTREQFDALTSGRCVYCDRPTTGTHKNGIDRIDSSVGYISGNCVTCCGQCNIAKKTLTKEEFIRHMHAVAAAPHADYSHVPRCMTIITPRVARAKVRHTNM